MDRIKQEDNSLRTKRDLTLPSPVKRPRTDYAVTNQHSGGGIFDFPELLTFQNTAKSILQKNLIVVSSTGNDARDEKCFLQLQDIKLIVTPTSVTDDADMLLPKVCVITVERHLPHLGKDLVTKSHKLLSYLPDEALGESHISTDMSSHSDAFCKCLGKSLEDKALVSTENDEDRRRVQRGVTQMQAFALTCDEEIICQSDRSPLNVVHDTDTAWSRSAGDEGSNQKWGENAFSENVLFSKEEQVENSSRSFRQYPACELIKSYAKKDHMGNFVKDFKNEEKLLQSQICESDIFTVCDEETKGQVNRNSMSKNSFFPVADISVFPHDVVLSRNTAAENVSSESDDLCGVKGEYAACKMKAWNEMADHTTEAPESERICQESTEEDNNVGLYGVIDPAIWDGIDREAEESTAGVELSPSIKVCEMEMPPPHCFDVRTSQEVSASNQSRQLYHQSIILQCNSENEDLCQSYTEPRAAPITSTEPYNMRGSQSSSPYSPTKLPPPEKFELFADHPYSAHVSKMVEISVEKDVKPVEEASKTAEHENSAVEVKFKDLQQQNEHKTERMETSPVDKQMVNTEHRNGNKPSVWPEYQHRAETYMLGNTHDLVAFGSPPTSDAVVPCQSKSSPSLNRSGTLSTVASACVRYNWMPGGVDIFEKIQLSPDEYGDNDADLGQPPHSTQGPESSMYHQAAEEKEREEEELQEDCHTEYTSNGFLNSDTRFDVPSFIPEADSAALGWPAQQPNCGHTFDSREPVEIDSNSQSKSYIGSTESDSPASDVNEYPGFERKKQFSLVLQELSLFFDISKSDFGSDRESWPRQCDDRNEPLKTDCSDSKEPLSSLDTGCHKNTDKADGGQREMCVGEPVISCKTGDDEQQVPISSHMCPGTCQDITEHQELWEVEQRRKTWSPSFTSQQLSHSPLKQPKRLEPLRTCSRPIRVGLSKRAKTKRLHRPHPYK